MVERSHAFGKEQYSVLDNFIFSRRKRQVVKRLPANPAVIADFGSGFDCRLLRSLGVAYPDAKLIGVDTEFDPALAEFKNLSLVHANLNEALPVADASVDVALSLAVLEHLEKPEVFVRELFRVVKPGGVVLLTTPGPTSKPLLEFLAFSLHIIDEHEIRDHKHYFSSSELHTLFASVGFSSELIDARTFIFGMNNVVKVVR